MESDAQPGELYDFLYRDSSRINSYYAQMFGGLLSSLEQGVSKRSSVDSTVKANVAVVSGDVKSTRENQESDKRSVVPHDLTTTDVLSALVERNLISYNIPDAQHGSLIWRKAH